MKAFCLNNISKVALDTLSGNDKTVEKIEDADSILVRSQDMHEMKFDKNILAVARAGAGVNNIPLEDYAKEGVVVFNTPGANANAVKELVLAGLLLASRDIIGGNKWVLENKDDENIAKTAEKAKKAFAGNEIKGKTLGIIGLGAIGILVADAAIALGMKVIGYDPYMSIQNAVKLNKAVKYVEKLDDVTKDSDFITIHVPALPTTKGMINKDVIAGMKDGAIVLNFARDTLVNEDDMLAALESGKIKKYVVDFVTPKTAAAKNVIATPHLGASTDEAEDNCAVMAINELKDYIENGNITNSVNYPAANAGAKTTAVRVCIHHMNIPGVIAKFSDVFSKAGSNIVTLVSKSKGDYAYSILDIDKACDISSLESMSGVIRVRTI
ncbi:MAG: 3-phosphoglycerate dehydrogenase [Acholeplasmatales bacterium]|nr:3-phosphoglycerate dehydrogenase [Acholeplasmatales bacterium]